MRTIALLARRRLDSEDGFTLVELMVASGILLVSLLALAYAATISFSDIALSRQRQAATGLTNQTMEQVRALPFDVVKKGLDNTDLATLSDPNITVTGSGSSAVYKYGGEEIPRGDNATTTPLVPHQATLTIGSTTFHRSVYVTYYLNNKTSNVYRVTVVVTWDKPARHGTSATVQAQSLFYSPTGCLSTATHPFSAPCQPFLYASGQIPEGTITVTGSIRGIQLDHVVLSTSGAFSGMQLEQVKSIQGQAITSGAALELTGDAEQTFGSVHQTTGVDDDPTNPATDYQTVNLTQSAGSLSASGSQNTLSVTASAGDTGATTSTVTANTPSHLCANTGGTNQTDNYPCGNSNSRQLAASTMTLDLNNGSRDLGVATLASLAAAPSSSIAYTKRTVSTGDGKLHVDATRRLGTLTLAGLLPNMSPVPAGWAGYLVRLTGFTDSASAESGVSTAAPTVSTAGTISYWNGTGYSTKVLAAGAASSFTVANVHAQDPAICGGGCTTVDISSTFTTGGTAKNDPANCGASCTRTQASATSNSPLVGDIHYVVAHAGNTLADINFHVDLGSIAAATSYTQAPTGA